jgi:hypothetical protein
VSPEELLLVGDNDRAFSSAIRRDSVRESAGERIMHRVAARRA